MSWFGSANTRVQKDAVPATTITDPRFNIDGFCNQDLREFLAEDSRHVGKTQKKRSWMITRALHLHCDHGVIDLQPEF